MSDPNARGRITARSESSEEASASDVQRPAQHPDAQVTAAPAPVTIRASAGGMSQITLGCLIGAGIIALALLIAGALVAFAVRESTRRVAETVERANPASIIQTVIPLPTPTVVVRPPAVLQVRAISELATAQSLLSTIVEVQQARVGNVLYEKLVLIACGRVKAGVALTQIRDSDVEVSDDGRTVRVKLPRAQLLDAYLIDDSTQPCTTRVYDRTNLLLLPESKELEAQAREKALEAIRTTAMESGLLDDARRNAQIAIERILLNAGYERVEFIEE